MLGMTYLYNDLLTMSSRYLGILTKNRNAVDFIWVVLRMALVGVLVSWCRGLISWTTKKINRTLWPTAYIHVNDPSYPWIISFISSDPLAQAQIKDFQLWTHEIRSLRKKSTASSLRAAATSEATGEDGVMSGGVTWKGGEIIGQVLPTYNKQVQINFNGSRLWICRRMGFFARSKNRTTDHIQVKTFVWNRNVLKDFLVAAHQAYFSKEAQELLIFHAKRINPTWQSPVARPARPWSSVILPEGVKEDVLKDMTKFLSEKETSWYAARGIPHRRGYLFHGSPGSGKTTLVFPIVARCGSIVYTIGQSQLIIVTALASKLRLDIYVINPSQRGMDDAKLSKLFRDCPAKSVILIEDIDCIFPRGRGARNGVLINGSEDGDDQSQDDGAVDVSPDTPPASPMVGGSHDLAPSTVTLSGLLNAIDGVSSQEGCILIASTNHPEHLDPALSRAGRFDVHIPFAPALASQARALFLHFYPLADFLSAQEDGDQSSEKVKKVTNQEELDELAEEFVKAIFPGSNSISIIAEKSDTSIEAEKQETTEGKNISMAALQGYLLKYKEDPHAAVENAKEWSGKSDPEMVQTSRYSGLASPIIPSTPKTKSTKVGKVPLRKKVLKKNQDRTVKEKTVVEPIDPENSVQTEATVTEQRKMPELCDDVGDE